MSRPRARRTPRSALAAALDQLEAHTDTDQRADVALHLALARHLLDIVDHLDIGPSPTIAQIHGLRELRLTLTELARLVTPTDTDDQDDHEPDPELILLAEAIRDATSR